MTCAMFDLSLADINHAERERDLVADLRDRDALKATTIENTEAIAASAAAAAPAADRAPIDRPAVRRPATGIRAVGRQG